jgi:hypothetical protein
MRMKHILSVGFGALALGLVATGAQAAPVGGLGAAAAANGTDAGLVENVTWYGRHHYRYHYGYHYGYKPYYYGHYGYKPYYYGHYGHYRPHYRWHKPYGHYGYGGYRHGY